MYYIYIYYIYIYYIHVGDGHQSLFGFLSCPFRSPAWDDLTDQVGVADEKRCLERVKMWGRCADYPAW